MTPEKLGLSGRLPRGAPPEHFCCDLSFMASWAGETSNTSATARPRRPCYHFIISLRSIAVTDWGRAQAQAYHRTWLEAQVGTAVAPSQS
jgi:hypothetical protein